MLPEKFLWGGAVAAHQLRAPGKKAGRVRMSVTC